MMEFCGRSHDYFSRVKAADTNKILGKLPAVAAPSGPDKRIRRFHGGDGLLQ
jgi:hypothetical protein